MSYIKICAVLGILTFCTCYGFRKGGEIKKRYEELLYLKKIAMLMRGEIKYNRAILSDVFSGLGQRLKQPYKQAFLDMAGELKEHFQGGFRAIWERNFIETAKKSGLKQEDLEPIKELGENLGYLDLEMQLKVMDLYLEKQELKLSELRVKMSEDIKLCRVLGIMAGLFISILII